MQAIPDQRKFIRDIKGLIKSEMYESYFEEQEKWGQILSSKYAEADIHDKPDIDRFAANNSDITEELQLSMERALLKARSQQLKTKPSENVSKSISLMMEVDSRQFRRMNTEERETLKAGCMNPTLKNRKNGVKYFQVNTQMQISTTKWISTDLLQITAI